TNCSWMHATFVEHASGDQYRKSALVSGAVVETVCTLCHISLSAYHRASPNVRWSRFSRCPDADCILPASAIGWNGTKVWNVMNRGARGFPKRTLGPAKEFSGQNRPRVWSGSTTLRSPRDWASTIFSASVRKFPGMVWAGGFPRSSLRSLTADETATDAISDGGCRRAAP